MHLLPRFLLAPLAGLLVAVSPVSSRAENVYFIGNSVTDSISYDGLASLAAAAGRDQTWARHIIPGAPLEWLWDHPNDGFFVPSFGPPRRALVNHPWSVLSLQPFDRDLDSDFKFASQFIELLFGAGQPTRAQLTNRIDTRILIYGRWPRRDEDAGRPARGYPELWSRDYPSGGANSNESAAYPRQLVARLSAANVAGVPLANRVFLVPVGDAMLALDARFRAGQVPGYQDVFDLYSDGIHLTNVGAYVAACTFHSVIHRTSPVGLPVPSNYQRNPDRPRDRPLDPALARLIQETVWTTVRAEPLSGVPADGRIVITTSAVPSAYQEKPYTFALRAAGAERPVFALASGALPPGVTLSPDGTLSGRPSVVGDYAFNVTVKDASGSSAPVTATYRLPVVADLVPKILTEAALPATPRGGRVEFALAASPGNGRLAWSVADGALPAGLALSPEGLLSGSPTREGVHEFTLRVNDEDAGDPGDTRRFILSVGRPAYGTFFIRRTSGAPRIDGDLGESFWQLSQGVANAQGPADNTVKFGALWDAENLYFAVSLRDADLLAAGSARPQGDRVSLLIDARHDRQAEFNQSHREFIIGLDGSLRERGGRLSGVAHAVLPAPGGWQLEVSIPWSNLGVAPGDDTVIGLDLVNHDEDVAESYTLTYARSTPDAPRPDQWASILLSSETVPLDPATAGRAAPAASSAPAAKPLVYEPFDYIAGSLHGASGSDGSGFAQPWDVEGGADATGFAVVEPSPALDYLDLVTSGRALSGGHRYGTIGRLVTLADAYTAATASGGEIWVSYLVRPLRRDAEARFALDAGGAVMHDNAGPVRVLNHNGLWRLALLNGSVTADTSVPVQAGVTGFHVLRIRNGAQPTVDLWINPALDAEPATPAAASARGTEALAFDCVNLYADHLAGGALFDEIRLGASFASVAPRRAGRLAPPALEPLPNRSLAAPATVRLATPTPGASVHYTLDGSTPGAKSPRATAPVRVPAGATLRAVAIGADGATSAVSGATY